MIAVTSAISRFFTWWLRELAACLPDRLPRLLQQKASMLVVTPADDTADFTLHRGGHVRRLGQLSLSAESPSQQALSDVLGSISRQYSEIVLQVPAANVLRRSVTLPLEAAENLREVLAFEMDRHTPFKASEVAYDYRVTATDAAARKITVDLAVLPRTMLERAASMLEPFGLAANRVGVADDQPASDRPLNFQLYDESPRTPAGQRRLLLALAAIAAGLAAVAWFLPLYFDQRAAAVYEARLEEARTAALQADSLKNRLTTAMDLNRFVMDRRAAMPTITSLLADITSRLPDDTWLMQLQLQDGKLTLVGYAPSAAPLIALLEASPLLTEVHFASSVTPDPTVGGESFNISATVTQDRGS